MDRKKQVLSIGIMLVAVISVFVVFDIPCLIKLFLGCSCPGCGMTRAFLSALRLDFLGAFYYHPLWVGLPLFVVAFVWTYLKEKDRLNNFILIFGVAVMVCTYVIRLLVGPYEVVSCDFKEGTIYKAIEGIGKLIELL